MSNYGLVLTGTKPPSMPDFRPRTAPSNRGHYGYHTIAVKSNVDETLFNSHNPNRMSEEINFRPPWTYKKKTPEEQLRKPKGRPLLWAPQPSVSLDGDVQSNFSNLRSKSYSNSSQTKYKFWRHTPTFIDESLFGGELGEPGFEAPWGDKKKKPRPYIWVPDTVNYNVDPEISKKIKIRVNKRPSSAIGTRSCTKPVWKP